MAEGSSPSRRDRCRERRSAIGTNVNSWEGKHHLHQASAWKGWQRIWQFSQSEMTFPIMASKTDAVNRQVEKISTNIQIANSSAIGENGVVQGLTPRHRFDITCQGGLVSL